LPFSGDARALPAESRAGIKMGPGKQSIKASEIQAFPVRNPVTWRPFRSVSASFPVINFPAPDPQRTVEPYLTIDIGAAILGRMNAELYANQSWWWLPCKEWVAG